MHKLYSIKENLIEDLEKYDKKDLSPSELEMVDKIAHAAKNVCKIIEYCEDGGYSEMYYPMDGRVRSFQSYGRGRNAARDSRGRYSSTGNYYRSTDDIRDRIQDMMYDAPNEETKRELQRVMTRLDTM